LDNLYRHLQEGCLLTKKEATFFAMPLKNLKGKIKIQEAIDSFKTYEGLSF
jgi:hypothetical protein